METLIDIIMNNKASIALAIPLITRAYHSLSKGGGLVGIWNSIMFGTNTPKDKKKG